MIIIDGNSVAARSFFGTHYNSPSFDEPLFVSAFLKSLLKALTILSATDNKAMICIDSKSWRKSIYPEYKHRDRKPDEESLYSKYIFSYSDICAEMKEFMPFVFVKKEGYEADDLIAYYVNKFDKVVIVSTDKDLMQLVEGEKIRYWDYSKEALVGVPDKGLFLHRLICLGDKSDNIPSIVPRDEEGKLLFQFGEKTVEKYYRKELVGKWCYIEPTFVNALVTSTKKGPAKCTSVQVEQMYANYERNNKLINLSLSPVHKEVWPINIETKYNGLLACKFLQRWIPDMWKNQSDRLSTLLNWYGGQV
jgi:5'-3' exonuclease